MAGIKDIAKKAGVSISTVSYALNGSPKIPENTRQRIQKIADELNYIPNRAARTLKNQKTKTIGVFLQNYGGQFYSQMIDGINTMLATVNYDLIVCCGARSHHFIPERMIDGAIILDSSFDSEEILKYSQTGSKIVVLDRLISHKNISQVLLDNQGGIKQALSYLKGSPSYQQLFLLTGPDYNFDNVERMNTVTNYLNETNYSGKLTIIPCDFTTKSGRQAAEQIQQQITDQPVSVLSLNDEMAFGVYEHFQEQTNRIGEKLSIIGFDNDVIGSYLTPKLTSVNYSKYEWGYAAAQKLIQLINGKNSEKQVIATNLLIRDSVKM
jgi:DNA-binding LacI/PurR family transcriptional regulator